MLQILLTSAVNTCILCVLEEDVHLESPLVQRMLSPYLSSDDLWSGQIPGGRRLSPVPAALGTLL